MWNLFSFSENKKECHLLLLSCSFFSFFFFLLFVTLFFFFSFFVGPLNVRHPLQTFVCVEILQPSQPSGVMSIMVSLPNHTFTGQASKQLSNCPSWISGRERMTIENYHDQISTKECCRPGKRPASNLLATSWTCIKLSHRDRQIFKQELWRLKWRRGGGGGGGGAK